ncbi:MAG: ribbon-helix-helix domain-containing protein [Alphaproteobacteria bacterium]|nr:ribbon-helix-helix domain-containing protein [Alphaproteobacteria bacterium]
MQPNITTPTTEVSNSNQATTSRPTVIGVNEGMSKQTRSKSSLVSRNVTIAGHRTSVRLEPEMWNGLAEICRRECASMHEICTVISGHKPNGSSLTAAIRVFVMAYFRAAATEDGHNRSGHGPGGQLMMTMMLRKENNPNTPKK